MIKYAASFLIFFCVPILSLANDGDRQAHSFIKLYSSLCLGNLHTLETLKTKLKKLPTLPNEKAKHFLGTIAGDAWPIPNKNGTFVLVLAKENKMCAIYARKAKAETVTDLFSTLVKYSPDPLIAKEVSNEYSHTEANGKIHTLSYEWFIPNAPSKMLFTLTTSASPNAKLQALASAALVSTAQEIKN